MKDFIQNIKERVTKLTYTHWGDIPPSADINLPLSQTEVFGDKSRTSGLNVLILYDNFEDFN